MTNCNWSTEASKQKIRDSMFPQKTSSREVAEDSDDEYEQLQEAAL